MKYPISDPPFSTDTWIGGASGSWTDAANWSLGVAPDNYKDAIITGGAPITITFPSNNYAVNNLSVQNADFENGTGVLQNTLLDIVGKWSSLNGLTIGVGFTLVNYKGTVRQSGEVTTLDTTSTSIYNELGATWTITGDCDINGQGAAKFYNYYHSVFQRTSGTGTSHIRIAFESAGGAGLFNALY